MDFYGVVIIIATCFLIVCLIIMGLIMQKINKDNPFPPTMNPCPDSWEVKGNGCVIPALSTNTNIGTINNQLESFKKDTYGLNDYPYGQSGTKVTNPLGGTATINFNDAGWNSSGSTVCSQKKWASTYGISWDGVTNNNGC
jgi:hypothetical protein